MNLERSQETKAIELVIHKLTTNDAFAHDHPLFFKYSNNGFVLWDRTNDRTARVTGLDDNDGVQLELDVLGAKNYANLVMSRIPYGQEHRAATTIFNWFHLATGPMFIVDSTHDISAHTVHRNVDGTISRIKLR